MVTKLFAMFPVGRMQNLDLAIEGYVEALRSLPWQWVSVAIGAVIQDPALVFAPPVGRIRQETALQYMRAWRARKGRDPDRDELGHPVGCADPERWLGLARDAAGLAPVRLVASIDGEAEPLRLEEAIRDNALVGGHTDDE